MKHWKGVKLGISVIVGIALSMLIFSLWIVSLFSGHGSFHSALLFLTWISGLLLLTTWNMPSRIFFRAAIIVFLLCASGLVILLMHETFIASIPVLRETGVNLEDYRPSPDNQKLARLGEESHLKLHEPVPRLDGATALYPLYAAFVNAVYPQGESNTDAVRCSTTSTAYERLISGDADLIFCAEPSEVQRTLAREKGVDLVLTPIGKEAFVFFVNSKNPVHNLTTHEIVSIYSGRTKDWEKVGGKGPIRVFQRKQGSGSQTILEKIMQGEPLLKSEREDVIDGMGGIIDQTADYKNYRGAIGYSFLYYTTRMASNGDITILSIDGISPSPSSIKDGSYPYTASFYAVTTGNETPEVRAFIDWILSDQGQSLVEKTGYTPLR